MKGILILLQFLVFGLLAQARPADNYTRLVQPAVFSLSRVMMHDVVNPPAASRYYAYCLLGAYQLVAQNDTKVPAPQLLIRHYPALQQGGKTAAYRLAALFSILETGKLLLPSGYMLEQDIAELVTKLQKRKVPQRNIDTAIAVAQRTAAHIVAFSKKDDYGKLSAKLRYTPLKEEGRWFPTPPSYMEAVEPHWKTVRPLVIDSCNQFAPQPPTAFSKEPDSDFYKLAKEVYDLSKRATPEQLEIAAFWDCNPFAVATSGHLSLGFKKISPGGHWMNIAGIAAQKASLDFEETILLQTSVAIALMDAFISCWDEKYRSSRIRPETFINKYIDVQWQPLLQTPPFPEYPSGHSVVSAASAEVLTYLLGDDFAYTDDSEVMFELAPRKFSSFRQAAEEAAISRLYGGIHFRDAITQGMVEGKAVGETVVARLKQAGVKPLG